MEPLNSPAETSTDWKPWKMFNAQKDYLAFMAESLAEIFLQIYLFYADLACLS